MNFIELLVSFFKKFSFWNLFFVFISVCAVVFAVVLCIKPFFNWVLKGKRKKLIKERNRAKFLDKLYATMQNIEINIEVLCSSRSHKDSSRFRMSAKELSGAVESIKNTIRMITLHNNIQSYMFDQMNKTYRKDFHNLKGVFIRYQMKRHMEESKRRQEEALKQQEKGRLEGRQNKGELNLKLEKPPVDDNLNN